MPSNQIPYATEQGIFGRVSGKIFSGNREFAILIFRFARELISARWSTDQVDQKNLFLGLGNSRLSRSVLPSYSRRRIPRLCNSGTTRSTKSSSPPGG